MFTAKDFEALRLSERGNAAWITLAAIVLAISFFAGPVLASILSFWSAF